MRPVAIAALLALTGCSACVLRHGESYRVYISPLFTSEQVQGIRDGEADWQKWVPVTFDNALAPLTVAECDNDYTVCIVPVSKQTFEKPEKTWGVTNCSPLKNDSCRVALAVDWDLGPTEWQALAAHELGHAMGSRPPSVKGDDGHGHEPAGSGALMSPTLESVVITCTDMARWYSERGQVVPPCPRTTSSPR